MNPFQIKNKRIKLQKILKSKGLKGILTGTFHYCFPPRVKEFDLYKSLLRDKLGLEVGGPSFNFSKKGCLPIYQYLYSLDNCNFSSKTVWEGNIKRGQTFLYDKAKPKGYQYIAEATNLFAEKETYDVVISSHAIEHVANPIKALLEFKRVIVDGGYVLLIVPHKEGTFDHRRPLTTLKHLIHDYERDIDDSDSTHVEEVLKFHDINRDWDSINMEEFAKQLSNFESNRCIHHHTFNISLVLQMLDFVKLQIIACEAVSPFHIVALAQKRSHRKIANSFMLNAQHSSPFKLDKFPILGTQPLHRQNRKQGLPD